VFFTPAPQAWEFFPETKKVIVGKLALVIKLTI
jgi:hypothetical protein